MQPKFCGTNFGKHCSTGVLYLTKIQPSETINQFLALRGIAWHNNICGNVEIVSSFCHDPNFSFYIRWLRCFYNWDYIVCGFIFFTSARSFEYISFMFSCILANPKFRSCRIDFNSCKIRSLNSFNIMATGKPLG